MGASYQVLVLLLLVSIRSSLSFVHPGNNYALQLDFSSSQQNRNKFRNPFPSPSIISHLRGKEAAEGGVSGGTAPSINDDDNDFQFIKETLQDYILFRDMTEETFREVASSFHKIQYKKGSVICREGDDIQESDFMLIIQNGICKVSVDGKDVPEPYGVLAAGSLVGELALIYDSGRHATVTADTEVLAFKMDRSTYKYLVNRLDKNRLVEDIKSQLPKVDEVVDKIAGVKARYSGAIIRQFKPKRTWLWTRWRGTIFEQTWKTTAYNMIVSILFSTLMGYICKNPSWTIGMIPDKNDPTISRLVGLNTVWKYLMQLSTFILTFFLSQAYAMWRDVYNIARKIQGRLGDIGLLLATSATRDKNGKYTPESKRLQDDIASYSRLFHAFVWAANSKTFNVLLSGLGLRRMLSRGLITRPQYNTLLSLNQNPGSYCNACMMWIFIRCLNGTRDGSLTDDREVRKQLYAKMFELRSTYATIPDVLDGRIPLAYAHFVQVLVDSFVFLAPFALYSELGIWSTPAVGFLTMFYSGFLDLAKVLLDPLDNDDFYQGSVNMDVGVLIRESNSGSTHWKLGAEVLPF